MTSIYLCLLALVSSFIAGRRSLVAGLVAVLGIGYIYGITRANLTETFSHFIFDAGLIGFYLALLASPSAHAKQVNTQPLKRWVAILIAWPAFLFLLPLQDPLVQLVGLRGNTLLLPFLLIGARLESNQVYKLALWIAALNLVAFGFAGSEFMLGVERFFPYSPVTEIIYQSQDILGYSAFRIPASFTSAHAYAGTMVMTIPLLVGAWTQKTSSQWRRYLLVSSLAASLLGVFMSGTRVHFVVMAILLIVITLFGRLKLVPWMGWLMILSFTSLIVSSEERLQRFMTLQDTEYVMERIQGSVNKSFFELVDTYPFGNGLGGGGTSLPYFLQNLVRDPVVMENEYARIALEQGIPGLVLWAAFILWVFTRQSFQRPEPWYLGRRLAWCASVAYFATGLIGIGLLTSIPQTCLLFLSTGWIAVRQRNGAKCSDPAFSRFTGKSEIRVQQHG